MTTDTDVRIGSELLGYRIEALIGRGGMSVYRAGAAWITNSYFSTELLGLDPTSLRVAKRIPLTFRPGAVWTDGAEAWLADARDGTVVEVDSRSSRVIANVKVGGRPTAIAAGGGSLWVALVDRGALARLDPKRHRVVATIKVGPNPTHLAVGEGGVWVTVHPD